MKKLRVIKMSNGTEFKGFEDEFELRVGQMLKTHIIYSGNGFKITINPDFISSDALYDPAKKSKKFSVNSRGFNVK